MTTAIEPRQLRGYQTEAVDAIESAWADGLQRVGVALPTGTGKSTVIGETGRRAYRRGDPVVALAHRGELLDQMKRDLLAVDPTIPDSDVGIVRAEMDEHDRPIVFATLQTLATAKRRKALGRRRVVLWDEVHHAGAEGFHTTLTELGGYDDALMAGFTATMRREDKNSKIGLGDVIEKVVFERDIRWAIKHGYLVQPHGLTVRIKGLDKLDDVRTIAGDFHNSELAEVMEAASDVVVDKIKEYAADRQPIIFAASVEACHNIADALTDAGFPAIAVTGAINYADRKPLYDAYRSGEAKAMVTVQVLTEGADFPMCDAVVLARPTRSKNLYSQMIGRALRLHPGKTDALVLDLAGSARSMKLVNLTQLDTGADVKEVDEQGTELDPYAEEPELIGEGGGAEPAEIRTGPVELEVIDLLAASDVVWLNTTRGVPFISLMDPGEVIYLWPRDGVMAKASETDWAVSQINTRTRVGGWVSGSGLYAVDEPDYVRIDLAMEAAELWITETDQQLPAKKASWRRKSPPTDKQVDYARSLHIVGADNMTKAELSDAISIAKVSRFLDRYLEV
jgi:superfamily II DNA or RNA helicase